MSRTNAAEQNYLQHWFQNADWPNIGDAAGLQNSLAAGNFYVSLHTADPGEAGNQTTNEATFVNYTRQAVPRSAAGWAVADAGGGAWTADNVNPITFPEAGSGPQVITHFGIGTNPTPDAGNLIWSGALTAPRTVDVGITLQFAAGALNVQAD